MQNYFHIALAGNPNVGKSTVFNALTGMHQHTGNWTGKTVTTAEGSFIYQDQKFLITDLPGTYSLRANSPEEAVARDYLCISRPDAVVIVCDACCLERNLNLVFQIMEITDQILLCINLLDEAEKKQIAIDLSKLEQILKIPVIGMSARNGRGISELKQRLFAMTLQKQHSDFQMYYHDTLEASLQIIIDLINPYADPFPTRWAALRILEQDSTVTLLSLPEQISDQIRDLQEDLIKQGFSSEQIQDHVICTLMHQAEQISQEVISSPPDHQRDRKIDHILLSRIFGIPIMLLFLSGILWLTMIGANVPSALLSDALFRLGEQIRSGLLQIHAPEMLTELLIDGIYKILAWVIGVMLPPMAIFFPLFTLLEDAGYLPRIAFQLDHAFQCAGACGKQCLTMMQGLGCNACGVTGCRIIDSPRERMLAILTNVFTPCNGRFPLLISMISMFFAAGTAFDSVLSAMILLLLLLLGTGMTLLISKLLSRTILKGLPSFFLLELPPYRKPQIGKVLIRSVFDRTLFVLGRACVVAAPAGLIIWILAHYHLLSGICTFLHPFANLFGLDGVILTAFLLGFPANEIVIPLMLMMYSAQGTLTEINDLSMIKQIFISNGWTWGTALCTILFSLMHFPCSTTVLTIYKETKSLKWTLFSILLPTLCGLSCCFLVNLLF